MLVLLHQDPAQVNLKKGCSANKGLCYGHCCVQQTLIFLNFLKYNQKISHL